MTFRLMQLKELCEIRGGFAFKSEDFIKNGIAVIRIGDIANGKVQINENTAFVPLNYIDKCSSYIVNKNDILIALSGATTGKYAVYNYEFNSLLNQRVAKIVPKEKYILPRYLYHYLEIIKRKIFYLASGAAQPNISPSKIGDIEIPVPEIKVQKQIVQVLDKAQGLIDNRKEQIEKLEELLQSVFLDMFGDPFHNLKGWKEKKLINLVYNVEKANLKKYPNLTIRYIDISSIDNSKKSITKYSKYAGELAPSRAKQIVRKDDILVSTVRPNLKNIALIRDGYDNLIASTGFCVIRVNKSILNYKYLFEGFKTDFFTNKLVNLTVGANYPAVKNSDILSMSIPLPPIELQNQFAQIVEEVEKQKEQMEKSLAEMENLFNSIMQKAFKGELFN